MATRILLSAFFGFTTTAIGYYIFNDNNKNDNSDTNNSNNDIMINLNDNVCTVHDEDICSIVCHEITTQNKKKYT